MPTFDSVLVTGNQTINGNLQVDMNETISGNLHVSMNETVAGNLQVNMNQTINGHLELKGSENVVGHIAAGGTINAATQLIVANQPTVPSGGSTNQAVHFYATGAANQPGLVLKGTDGFNYLLFIDNSGGNVSIGIQRA